MGVFVSRNARPRLVGNEIWGNRVAGIAVDRGGDPFLSGNTIRDHAGVFGRGVFVQNTSHGLATILPDNVFLRNEGGDVVREPAPLHGEEEEEVDEEEEEEDEDEEEEDDEEGEEGEGGEDDEEEGEDDEEDDD